VPGLLFHDLRRSGARNYLEPQLIKLAQLPWWLTWTDRIG
jgi:hypothetical protein